MNLLQILKIFLLIAQLAHELVRLFDNFRPLP
ncbi:hypothetical protein TCK1_1107 [Pseudomonas monteilii]|uniref:Uncharacterized protein n=1 Tax=Pseudomonas monteilii TaxID=76759 RepID=A0AAE6V0V4_9PSED|nr:hypothetical protein TCK1_1107 [Pseudomonas monteilii]